jgi:4-hydroxy-tetrahydrodipicolinate synthase
MSNSINIDGVVPVMLTPFTGENRIEEAGLERLTEWYLARDCAALFAVCQSSEMQKLSLQERVDLASMVVTRTAGRVPVVASGHVADSIDDQCTELAAMCDTGIDALVLVTNRLADNNQGLPVFRQNLKRIMNSVPSDMPLGLYECPAPFRRLLSDDELKLCLDTGRFVVLKDVSCDIGIIERRLDIVKDTAFSIINANAAIAFDAMRAGSRGFAGVFTNFHPDLYVWLYENMHADGPLVRELVNFLALSACTEPMGYPGLAKIYHQKLGTFDEIHSRVIGDDIREKYWAIDAIVEHIHTGTEIFRQRISGQE